MTGTAALPIAYRDALRVACAAALDAGVFYDTDFAAFVLPRVARADPARDLFVGVLDEPAVFVEHSAWNAELSVRITVSPRGAWLLCRRDTHLAERQWFAPMMSDGSGAPFRSFDSYDTVPDYDAVHRRMAAYEVYLMRREVVAERSRARNISLIGERGFRTGSTFRNLRIGCERCSTVTITALHPPANPTVTVVGADDRGEGWLTLALTKQGISSRYRINVAATTLASAIDEAARTAPQSQSVSGTSPLLLG